MDQAKGGQAPINVCYANEWRSRDSREVDTSEMGIVPCAHEQDLSIDVVLGAGVII